MKKFIVALLILAVPATALGVAKINRQSTTGTAWDAPRTPVQFTAINATPATSDTLVTLTPTRDYVAAGTGTSFAVTAQKRLRLTQLCVSTKNAGAAVQGVQVRLRVDPTGTVTTADPAVAIVGAGTFVATANSVGGACATLDDDYALELTGTAQLGITAIGTNTAGMDLALIGYEY